MCIVYPQSYKFMFYQHGNLRSSNGRDKVIIYYKTAKVSDFRYQLFDCAANKYSKMNSFVSIHSYIHSFNCYIPSLHSFTYFVNTQKIIENRSENFIAFLYQKLNLLNIFSIASLNVKCMLNFQ